MSEGWHDPNRVAHEGVIEHRSRPGFAHESRIPTPTVAADAPAALALSLEMP
jgi:hypothetical protein